MGPPALAVGAIAGVVAQPIRRSDLEKRPKGRPAEATFDSESLPGLKQLQLMRQTPSSAGLVWQSLLRWYPAQHPYRNRQGFLFLDLLRRLQLLCRRFTVF